jgi:hypothetical protein
MNMIKELQQNETEIQENEEELKCSTYRLTESLIRSKRLIEVQQKLMKTLFNFQTQRNCVPRSFPATHHVSENPKRKQSEALSKATMHEVQRILTEHKGMCRLNDKVIDCLNHLYAIEDRNLAWNRQEDKDSCSKDYFMCTQ